MREVAIGNPLPGQEVDWLVRAVREFERATLEDVQAVITGFEVTNFTETRTLNAGTATATDVANFVATFFDDLKNMMDRSTGA